MIIELCLDPIQTLIHIGSELVDSAVQIVDSTVQIVEPLVLQPGGEHERNDDRQGNLNEGLLQNVCGRWIHDNTRNFSFA